ncbi:hypothetical protein H0O01_03350 [Candidatus Micrarchaeota archaeon]|nr:hypothetical protein [Candidatus Micrarchaeota archaeon]
MDWFILAAKAPNPFAAALMAIVFFLICAAIFFYFGVRSYLNRKKIGSIPTSKANAVAPGLVELTGIAKSIDSNLRSPIFGKECVWYRTTIERTLKGRRTSFWREFEYARKEHPQFLLEDDSGLILVDSTGAENKVSYQVYSETGPQEKLSESCKKYLDETLGNPESKSEKYHYSSFLPVSAEYMITERIIESGRQLYVMGTARMPNFQLPRGLASNFYIGRGDVDETFIIAESKEKTLGGNSIGILLGLGGAIGMVFALLYALVAGQALVSIILFLLMLSALAFVSLRLLKKSQSALH